jgi:capsular polysaccharide biosynthesis protein
VTDPVIFSLDPDNGEQDRLGVYGDFADTEPRPSDFVPGLVSLGFLKAAIWRSAWLLALLTALGLAGGFGAYVKYPHSYQASASVLVTLTPYEDAQTAGTNNQAIAETTPVAALAVQQLGLQVSASNFLNSYSVVSLTSRLMTITASGPSPEQAVLRGRAVANAFLTFRATEEREQQKLVLASLNQQIDQAKQSVDSIDTKVSQLSSEAPSATQSDQLTKLHAQQTTAANALSSLQQAVAGNEATTQPDVTAALQGSQVLSVTSLPFPKKKILVTDIGLGLVAGLGIALAIIIIRALISDRLRRRDDIAYALDAPVRLSLHTLSSRRRLLPWPGRAAKRKRDMRRIVAYLHSTVPPRTQGPAGLAVVAVDNAPVVARAVAELATSHAARGEEVVVADLSQGAHLAHLLGVKGSGAHPVSRNGVHFTMAVPDRNDPAPAGPLPPGSPPARHAQPGDPLIASWASADFILTLVTLDPAVGGEHLTTWTSTAVVVVSAGQSSAERIHGVGEMIRLAGTRLDSVVLIGADKDDASLGLMRRPDEQAGVGVLGR